MDFTLQELYKNIGVDGQKKLVEKTVTIIGLGGVGSTVMQALARNGINLRIIDKGRILEKDIPRQTFYRLEDVTKFKAKQAKKILEEINNEIKVRTFHEDLNDNNVFLIESDLIIDLTNNLKASEMINKFAFEKKIPYIFANYVGDKGNILIVDRNNSKTIGPCINCVLKNLELKPVIETGIYSPVTLILASLVLNLAYKNLLGIENKNKTYSIDAFEGEIKVENFKIDKSCKICSGK